MQPATTIITTIITPLSKHPMPPTGQVRFPKYSKRNVRKVATRGRVSRPGCTRQSSDGIVTTATCDKHDVAHPGPVNQELSPLIPLAARDRKRKHQGSQRQKPLEIPPAILARLRTVLDPCVFLHVQEVATSAYSRIPIAIATLTNTQDVCQTFHLVYPGSNDAFDDQPLVPPPQSLGSVFRQSGIQWEVPQTDIEAWLDAALEGTGIGIKDLLTKAVAPGAMLPTFCYMYQRTVDRKKEAACRPLVDMILLTAASMLKRVDRDYQHYLQPLLQQRARRHTPNKFNKLKLYYELDLKYIDRGTRKTYTGRVDWGIGLHIGQSQLDNSQPWNSGYRQVLSVIEAKVPASLGRATAQVLAYMSCIFRTRERAGLRSDLSTYGVATDGIRWQFFCISPYSPHSDGGSQRNPSHSTAPTVTTQPSVARSIFDPSLGRTTSDNQLDAWAAGFSGEEEEDTMQPNPQTTASTPKPARVSETPVFNISHPGDLRSVLAHVTFLIVRAMDTLTPNPTPIKPGASAAALQGDDDGLIIHPDRSADTEALLERLVSGDPVYMDDGEGI
ncbi:hypothetical protein EV426DRAFT_594954 [Tirmania nivea]|nr:hypothetical protein EV426DRAFT_594954 [Tirmania nivea]